MALAGPNYAGTVSDNSGVGTEAWTSPTNAQGAADTAFAYVTESAIGGGSYKYNTVKLIKGGTVQGNNNSDASTITGTPFAWKDFGTTSDLWDLTIADTDIRASDTGGVLSLLSTKSITTHYLYATNFGFTTGQVPSGSTINGVQLGFDVQTDASGASFIEGTPVTTAYGLMPIEKVEIGETVLSQWFGKAVLGTVTDVVSHEAYVIAITDSEGEVTYPTATHRFWTGGLKRWTKAVRLNPGDTLYKLKGSILVPVQVTNVDRQARKARVYNLKVSPGKSFFANGFLVHNGAAPTTFGVDVDAIRMQVTYTAPTNTNFLVMF